MGESTGEGLLNFEFPEWLETSFVIGGSAVLATLIGVMASIFIESIKLGPRGMREEYDRIFPPEETPH